MTDFILNDDFNPEEFGILPINYLTEEEQLIKALLLNTVNTNAIFFEPILLENQEILKTPEEYREYDENGNLERLEIRRYSMRIQDAIWYSATKTGLLNNPEMYSHRLHLAYPINKYFRNYKNFSNQDKEQERERLEEQRKKEQNAKERELRYKEEVEFAARVMAHQQARKAELNHLATEENDKLGFLFKECGKMIHFLRDLPFKNNNYVYNVSNEQAKNFNFAYQKFMKYINEEKNNKNFTKEKVRTLNNFET